MRARLTLILTIAAAVLATLFAFAGLGVSSASATGAPTKGTGGWFAGPADVIQLEVELASRVRPLARAELAALAATITAPPPPPPAKTPDTFAFPANGPITSPFGRRWGRAHQGVDIDAPTGSPIIAAQGGTVTLAGWKNGYGQTVMIDHGNGVTTLYAHQARLGVQVGQVVERGQFIGTVGATGQVTAAHLHYEVHVNGVPRNPGAWL